MSARLDSDPEILDLVRRADPMLDPRVQADAGLDTESALRLLTPELDRPPGSQRLRRRLRPALRIAMLAGAVAAAAFVVANVASTGSGSAVPAAQAKTMIRHARAALEFPSGAIVEQDAVTTLTAPDGSTSTSEAHEWLSTSRPYDNRLIMIQNGNVRWEQAIINARLDLYDPNTNTVYLAPAPLPHLVPDNPNWNSALAEIRNLLSQPNVTVNSTATLDGAPAIEFTFDGGRFSYWASPTDYRPLQSEDRQTPLPDGQTGVSIVRYPIARVLTAASAPSSLLSLQAQHPGATVDTSSADYQAAFTRLGFPPEELHPAPPAIRR
jgi:hypothetical protein